jgi:anti-anti-sigma regulatory factor
MVIKSVTESVTEPAIETAPLEPVLHVQLQAAGTACRLVLRGDLCDTTLAALGAQVDQLGCMPCQDVVVDIRWLNRLDTVGANVLLGLSHYVAARGGSFRVTGAREEVAVTLRTVASGLLPPGGDVGSAVEGVL